MPNAWTLPDDEDDEEAAAWQAAVVAEIDAELAPPPAPLPVDDAPPWYDAIAQLKAAKVERDAMAALAEEETEEANRARAKVLKRWVDEAVLYGAVQSHLDAWHPWSPLRDGPWYTDEAMIALCWHWVSRAGGDPPAWFNGQWWEGDLTPYITARWRARCRDAGQPYRLQPLVDQINRHIKRNNGGDLYSNWADVRDDISYGIDNLAVLEALDAMIRLPSSMMGANERAIVRKMTPSSILLDPTAPAGLRPRSRTLSCGHTVTVAAPLVPAPRRPAGLPARVGSTGRRSQALAAIGRRHRSKWKEGA